MESQFFFGKQKKRTTSVVSTQVLRLVGSVSHQLGHRMLVESQIFNLLI